MNWLGKLSDTLTKAEGFISDLDSSAARVAARTGILDQHAVDDDAPDEVGVASTANRDATRTPAPGHGARGAHSEQPAASSDAPPVGCPAPAQAVPPTAQTAPVPQHNAEAACHDDWGAGSRQDEWEASESAQMPPHPRSAAEGPSSRQEPAPTLSTSKPALSALSTHAHSSPPGSAPPAQVEGSTSAAQNPEFKALQVVSCPHPSRVDANRHVASPTAPRASRASTALPCSS
jgi:hypothetical protein